MWRLCFDCGAFGVLIMGQLVFRLLGSWCFHCGAIGILIVGQLVFWLWGSCAVIAMWRLCFDCGRLVFWLWGSWCLDCYADDVLIVGQLVFWLWGSCAVIAMWRLCFDCGAFGVLILGQLMFRLLGSCAVRAMWCLWSHHPSFSPTVAKAHQWPYSYICWEDFWYGERTVSYSVWSDRRRTWGGLTAWELNVALVSCSLIGSI